jgi:hypothetical protein
VQAKVFWHRMENTIIQHILFERSVLKIGGMLGKWYGGAIMSIKHLHPTLLTWCGKVIWQMPFGVIVKPGNQFM